MPATTVADSLKLFAITSQLIEHNLDRVESEHGLDLRRGHRKTLVGVAGCVGPGVAV